MSIVNQYHRKYLTKGRKKYPERRDENGWLVVPKTGPKNEEFLATLASPKTKAQKYEEWAAEEERKLLEKTYPQTDAMPKLRNQEWCENMSKPKYDIAKKYPGDDSMLRVSFKDNTAPLKESIATRVADMSKPQYVREKYKDPSLEKMGPMRVTMEMPKLKAKTLSWVEANSKPKIIRTPK